MLVAGAAAAWGIHAAAPHVPVLLAALVLGAAVAATGRPTLDAGTLNSCTRFLLRLGVVLVGFGFSVRDLGAVGWVTAIALVALTAGTLLVGRALARRIGLGREVGLLVA